jgi:activator of 2-hydroxyglutaryl-CoA dehydratase
MKSFGINAGSSSIKAVLLEDDTILWSGVLPHEGNLGEALWRLIPDGLYPEGIPCVVTGTEGRKLFMVSSAIEPLCIETALQLYPERFDAVVSMGGEDLVVYTMDGERKITATFSGSKCASGTGEFFKQQLARMDMKSGRGERHSRRLAGPPSLDQMLGFHEERLYPSAQQARGFESRHRRFFERRHGH